ncbi:MAG TPA: HAMP domain-containing sensor histidine kinase [Streptosporangiaceae bacterium]
MRDISSPLSGRSRGLVLAGLRRLPRPAVTDLALLAGLRRLPRPALPRPALPRPAVPDLTWVTLWVIGLACVVLYIRWEAIPFHFIWVGFVLLTLWLMTWHLHRRQVADSERHRVSEENARLLVAQRRFLQDASHQLKTPITIALGHAELLAGALADREQARDIRVVVGELTRLKSLSERLLLIAASENPDFLRPEPVALDQFVADVLRRWRPTAPRRWQLGQLDAAIVSADRERLGLAVDALLENAVQHTAAGDVIRLSARAGGRRARPRLVIEDAGSGIPRSEIGFIFDRFWTGSPAEGQARKTRGTGLGLPLVRAIAHGHGGDVRVRSTPGTGSTFEFVFPADPAKTLPSARAAEFPSPAAAGDPLANMRLG